MFIAENPKHEYLMNVMDKINKASGNKVLKLACQDQKRNWKMKQEKLSPRYTTNLKEILTVKAI